VNEPNGSGSTVDLDRRYARRVAAEFIRRGDDTGWFERLYSDAAHGTTTVPWAGLEPNPRLVEAVDTVHSPGRAVVVGCGFGDDAEFVASMGFATTAFDVSPTAIAEAIRRYPRSTVDYVVADLLTPRTSWAGRFDLVVEVFTLQVLTGPARRAAFARVAELVAPGGRLLIIAGAREPDGDPGEMPWPLTRSEIEGLELHGLSIESIVDFIDEDPRGPVRRWRAWLRRPPA
jgi:SAM-dependent methyltransferase